MFIKLAVVCPVFNEQSNVEKVTLEWLKHLDTIVGKENYHFIFINDGSTDKTVESIEKLINKYSNLVLWNKNNSGHGPTCIYAYKQVIALNSYEWIFQIDSDGQCDPIYFDKFWANRDQNPWQWGYRHTRDDGWQRIVVTKFLALFVWLGSGVYVLDSNVPYRLMPVKQLEQFLGFIPERFFLANVLLSVLVEAKYKIKWYPIHFRARFSGESKVKGFRFAKIGFKLFLDLFKMRKNFK